VSELSRKRTRAIAVAVGALALALPSTAAAERLPIFKISATGSLERTWDVPKSAVTERDCSGQEFIEGSGRQVERWKMQPLRAKVTRWRDGTPAIFRSGKAPGSVTRQATLLRFHEPGVCDPDAWTRNQAGDGNSCGTFATPFEVDLSLGNHRFAVDAHSDFESRFDDCTLYEDSGWNNIVRLPERRLLKQRRIVLRADDTIRSKQEFAEDANKVTRAKWTATLVRVGWHRWPKRR
jgi:hypothetical protein